MSGNPSSTGRAFGLAFSLLALAALLLAPGAGASTTPIAAYSFDEGEGEVTHDLAGVPQDGMLEGGASWVEAGKYGSAIRFQAGGEKMLVPDADALDLTGPFTLEAWAYPESEKTLRPLLSKGSKIGTGEASGYLLLSRGAKGKAEGYVADGKASKGAIGTEPLPPEQWSHVALTSDGETLRLYVDGEEAAEEEAVAAAATTGDLEIGHTSGAISTGFEGLIDEVRIFAGAMEQSEVEISMGRPVDPGLLEGTSILTYRRNGSAHNANFDRDGIDDYRVRADVAQLGPGLPLNESESPEPILFDLVHHTDCVNPDPWRESLGEYQLPDTEDPLWVPNLALNEEYESSYYGCLENSGGPLAHQDPTGFDVWQSSIVAAFEGNLDDSAPKYKGASLGGLAPGARIWSVRARPGSYHFGRYPEPFTYPVKYYGEAFGAPSSPSVPLACDSSQFEVPRWIGSANLISPWRVSGISPQYGGCTTTDQAESPVSVEMNSCTYTVHIDIEDPDKGTFDVACKEAGDEIEIDVLSEDEEETICTETIPPQAGLEGVQLEDKGAGSGRYVEIDAALEGVEYGLAGECVAEPVEKSDGELDIETDFLAENGADEPYGIVISNLWGDEAEWHPEQGVARLIAGLDWAIATREDEDPDNDIDVIETNIFCSRDDEPQNEKEIAEGSACDATPLDATIREATDHGIVIVNAAWEFSQDVSGFALVGTPDVLAATAAGDADGEPGGKSSGCRGRDDRRFLPEVNFGLQADIAAPVCGDTGGSNPLIAGAVTALASQCPASDRAGAEYIVDTLMAEGETGEIAEGGWEDDSGDEWKEPLLNLRDEEVFDPVLEEVVANEAGEPEGNGVLDQEPGEPEHCRWLSHQAQSDVDSDGRADLVAIDGEAGAAGVFAGAYEGPSEDPGEAPHREGFETSDPVTSLAGQIDSALLDGGGRHAIDSADADGDRNADLVLTDPAGGVDVYPGEGEGTVERGENDGGFGEAEGSLGARSFGFDGSAEAEEPVAVADVDGDERADLVALRNSDGAILTYAGQGDGSFAGTPVVSEAGLDSATPDRDGEYPLDAIDVTGEEIDNPETEDCRALEVPQPEPPDYFARHSCADLVTAGTDGVLRVYPGRGDGSFGAPIEAAKVDPIFDDGTGEEIIGLGDLDRDRRADLLTLEGETLKLRLATKQGGFEEASEPYAGEIDSSLTDGAGEELVALLDYSRDGLADLVSVTDEGTVLTYTARRDRTFGAPVAQEGSLPTVRQDPNGHELLAEKPILRRAGCTPIGCAPTPIAAYSFEEGEGGVAHDYSAGSHDGALKGGAAWVEAGKYGSAIRFGGGGDKVLVPDAEALDLTGPFTLEAWAYPESEKTWRPLISKGEKIATEEAAGYLLFSRGGEGKPRGDVADGSDMKEVSGPEALQKEEWSHLALTSDRQTLRLYVNGEEVAEGEAVPATATTGDLEIGHTSGLLSTGFVGLIDEVRIYDQALSEAQVQADGQAPIPAPSGVYLSGAQSEEAAKQPRFNAVAYPASASAGQAAENPFAIAVLGDEVECDSAEFSGQLTEAGDELALEGQYEECLTSGAFPTTVEMNSCNVTLDLANSGPPYTGSASISCAEGGDRIEIDIREEGEQICLVKLAAQSLGGAVEYENSQEGSSRGFTAQLAATGMQWTRSGFCLYDGKGSSGSDGELRGGLSLGGE